MASISRAFQVMELLARRGPMGMRAIAGRLEIPVGSTHRMLAELAAENVVDRTPDGGWDLSFRLHAIAGQHLERIGIADQVRPFAQRIAEETGETVNVYVVSHGRTVCIDKVRGNPGMQLDFPIGHRGPLNCGGAGKVVLAYLAEPARRALLREPIDAHTPQTITSVAELEAELGRIRVRGYAVDNQEVVPGVYCVSVPILDRNGLPAGAVSVSGPSVKAPGPVIAPLVGKLNAVCERVSRRLGYADRWPPLHPAPPNA